MKFVLKETHFQYVDDVKVKLLKRVTLDDLEHYFGQGKIHVQRCIDMEVSMLKGIKSFL